MQPIDQFSESCRYLSRAVGRHGWLAARVAMAAAIVTFLGTIFMPRSYYSEARLFVRFGRENQIDPTATGGQMVALYESRESEINSLIEILRSRSLLDRVVVSLGPEYVLYGKATGGGKATVLELAASQRAAEINQTKSATPPSRTHQLAVERLEREVSIAAPRKSNIISVSCKASSPAVAQQIVAKLVEIYLEEHLRVHRSSGTYDFFGDQAAQSLIAWQKAAGDLRDAKNRLGIVTIEGRR